MNESGKRIERVISHFGLNKNSFSREIGLTNNVTIGRILNEDRNPHPATLKKIVGRFPQISYNWLLTGEGDMLKESNQELQQSSGIVVADLMLAIKQHGEELKKQGERLDRMLEIVSRIDKEALTASTKSKHPNFPPPQAM